MTVAEGGAIAAISVVDPLDHRLAPLVLEVDVDVGRLLALLRHEALEQEVVAVGVDRGDAEHVADGGIGGAAAALAEDLLVPREPHDGIHGQEVGRVVELLDELELVASWAAAFSGISPL